SEVDVRALLPSGPEFDELSARLAAASVPYRRIPYWLETETVSTIGENGELSSLRAVPEVSALVDPAHPRSTWTDNWSAAAARDAFEMAWEAHAQPHETDWDKVAADEWVPVEWLPYLPFPTLNPAQAQAAPAVLNGRRHLVVVAPTGAGKTVIGMLAALTAIRADGRKAAWLVPQRSLTDELDRELAAWRKLGLRVERLSGEYAVDVPRLRDADLWVATTEKFESICRASSLRTALAQVACVVVDEIHLLGDTDRGPLLEALLARVRGADSPVRIVGLSATAANAEQVAEWLDAEPVRVRWRPTRLTWQLPVVPASGERKVDGANRTRLVTAITRRVTDDSGSVLVFCGTKRNVRTTALAIAADRGAPTDGVSTEDLPHLHRVCTSVGVGIHYKDWEHRHESERGFRERELDVLVATTTVAAGVNLPARAVVVRDTVIGRNELNVATVQQMFGRAGRIGAGETEGWAFLITDETEHAGWQAQLVAGYTIRSRIQGCLADHLLAEAAQGGIHTVTDAEQWWTRTLAYHQGTRGLDAVHSAVDLLIDGGYLAPLPQPDDTTILTVTDLGRITTRLMVPVLVGNELRTAFAAQTVPNNPDDAENVLGRLLATTVPDLAEAPVDEDQRPFVARLLRAGGRLERLDTTPPPPSLVTANACDPGDLAQVAFALVAHHPRQFIRHRRMIGGVAATILNPVLEQAPRYFGWLAAQGRLGTVHPWVAVVADDLGRRIRWRRLAPPRGAGRLLWICEQLATPLHVDTLVRELFAAARVRDVSNPDWPIGQTAPRGCQLDRGGYLALLRDRATDTTFTDALGQITVTCPNGAAVSVWAGPTHQVTTPSAGDAVSYPDTDSTQRGATVFTRRGDRRSHGWLATYDTISQHT
ncbi:MAG TPA: DEAD/DEAH box helicase, partial [Pseudonocardiaceae bacterium]|nr:DEAD/DEAH box helicase [Pseudonocardiaceae bacterium]